MEEQKITTKKILLSYISNAIIPGLCFIVLKGKDGLKKFLIYLVLYIILFQQTSGLEQEYRLQVMQIFGQLLALAAVIHLSIVVTKSNVDRKKQGTNIVFGIVLWIISGFIISAMGILSGIL